MKFFITFGQIHQHEIDDKVFDKDCIAIINAKDYQNAREIVFQLFKNKFSICNSEEQFDMEHMKYYPCGLIEVDKNE